MKIYRRYANSDELEALEKGGARLTGLFEKRVLGDDRVVHICVSEFGEEPPEIEFGKKHRSRYSDPVSIVTPPVLNGPAGKHVVFAVSDGGYLGLYNVGDLTPIDPLKGKTVIRFDGPPGPEAGRFVEVERNGKSINAGEWVQDGDYWLLVLDDDA